VRGAGEAGKGEGGELRVVDNSGVGEGVEEDKARNAQGIFRGCLYFDLLVLLDLCLKSVLLLADCFEIVAG
jgi:hypothetical protein